VKNRQRWKTASDVLKISTSYGPTGVAESIFGDRFTIGSRINALTAHAQTLSSCLKHTALDRLPTRRYCFHPCPSVCLFASLFVVRITRKVLRPFVLKRCWITDHYYGKNSSNFDLNPTLKNGRKYVCRSHNPST